MLRESERHGWYARLVALSSRRLIPLVVFGALHCGSSGSNAGPSLDGSATDSAANLAPIGVVREYHNWGWLGNNFNDRRLSRRGSRPAPASAGRPRHADIIWDGPYAIDPTANGFG
jgi:hypothetical protein